MRSPARRTATATRVVYARRLDALQFDGRGSLGDPSESACQDPVNGAPRQGTRPLERVAGTDWQSLAARRIRH